MIEKIYDIVGKWLYQGTAKYAEGYAANKGKKEGICIMNSNGKMVVPLSTNYSPFKG